MNREPAGWAWAQATLPELAAAMAAGELTARALTAGYLARIDALDRAGPTLRSVIRVSPTAEADAAVLDAERAAGRVRGPLHGIPVLLKDNIDTGDGMPNTAGSLALVANVPARDAPLVAGLRAAGAVILGKANLSEWANFRSPRSASGWSAVGGLTRNPYALDRSACGSSSGSAVAVAAGLCAAAVGTETDGSIVCPASVNGVVGLKPTVGLISRAGIIPISASQDTAGPMARSVAGVAAMLGAMTAPDAADPATLEAEGRREADYGRFLDPAGLRGARLGVARSLAGFHDRVDLIFEAALLALRRLGAVLVDPVELPSRGALAEPEIEVLLYEFRDGLNRYLAATPPAVTVRSLAELIAFNQAEADREMPHFGQDRLIQAAARGPLDEAAYQEARALCRRLGREEGLDALLAAEKLDAIVAPTVGPAWTIDLINDDHGLGGSSRPAAVAGYPHLTVPMGDVRGLPVGLSFFAGAFAEPTLLRLGFAFEQATAQRRPPTFLPSLP